MKIMYILVIVILVGIIDIVRKFVCKSKLCLEINPISYTCNIPNIIFRTVDNLSVPFSMYENCHRKWKVLNPSYTIAWYTNKDCDRFIFNHYPNKVFQAYTSLKCGAYKADLFRLCILYKYGGVYVDAYSSPYVSLKNMLRDCYNKTGKTFISALDSPLSGTGIHNGFMVAERKHPFLKQAINDIVTNVDKKYYGTSALDVTGPIALSRSINRVQKFPVNKKHKEGWNEGEIPFFLFRLEWGPNQNIYKQNKKILCKYYSFLYYLYRKIICRNGYHTMWKNRDIYF